MISIDEAVRARHSVRQYTDEPIAADVRTRLEAKLAELNREGNLHMSLVCDEPDAFGSGLAHYGSFRGVRNYLVIAGADAVDLDRRAGYYGEQLVLFAQQLGLNTCWVALTFKKRLVKKMIAAGDRLVIVIALGYGVTQGRPRKSKAAEVVSTCTAPAPAWFSRGVEFALLAPTAINQQKFRFELLDDAPGASTPPVVRATTQVGPYAQVDLGIAMLHFKLGAGASAFTWKID